MKRLIIISRVLFVYVVLSAQVAIATNTLEIVGGQTNVNSTATISVVMENDDDIVAFQMDIPIPTELSYVAGSATLNSSRIDDHVLSDTILPSGILRIIGYSMTNTPFTGSTGELVSFELQASSLPGTYSLNFATAVLGNAQSTNIITGTQNGTLMVMGPNISTSATSVDFGRVPLLGTNDRYVTIYNTGNTELDIQQISSSSQYFTVIGSTVFTIGAQSSSSLQLRFSSQVKGEYTETLTIHSDDADEGILEIEMKVVAFAVNELHAGNIFAFSGDYATLDFTINNMENVVGFQFDLHLPEALNFVIDSAFLSSRKTNHAISANIINGNILRVVAYSSDNQAFAGNDGLILQLGFNVDGVGGYYGISIDNVVIGDVLGMNAVSAYTGGSLQIAAADINASTSLNFGDVSILETSIKSLSIYNYGTDTLEIGTLQFTNSSFSSTQILPLSILPGNSSIISVSFANPTEGEVSGSLKVFSNDPDESPFVISLVGNAYVPNYIAIKDSVYTIDYYGDTIFVEIIVDNLESFTGFQFDLNYSDSLSCITDNIVLGERAHDHLIQVSEIDSNSIRLLSYSLSQTEYSGNSGPILIIPFVADTGIIGNISMEIVNAILGNSQSEDILWGITNGTITINENLLPSTITIQDVTVLDSQAECYDATSTVTVAGSGTTVEIMSGGTANFIAGETIFLKPGFHSHLGSEAHAYITTTGDYCSSLPPLIASIDSTGGGEVINHELVEGNINIYPNPTTGNFTIDFKGKETTADILLLNFQGATLLERKCKDELKIDIDMSYLSEGMYIIVIKTKTELITKKIIKKY